MLPQRRDGTDGDVRVSNIVCSREHTLDRQVECRHRPIVALGLPLNSRNATEMDLATNKKRRILKYSSIYTVRAQGYDGFVGTKIR